VSLFILWDLQARERLLCLTSSGACLDTPTSNGHEKKGKELLRSVGIDLRLGENKSNELSGGEQQRVAITRALANDPDIILADEPTGNLDSKTSKDIMQLLKETNERGKTIIVVTHDPQVASYTSRTFRLVDGRVV